MDESEIRFFNKCKKLKEDLDDQIMITEMCAKKDIMILKQRYEHVLQKYREEKLHDEKNF